jgi:predicted metal-binding membrane protein
MQFKQAVPLIAARPSRLMTSAVIAALLLFASVAWFALVAQARMMGPMPVTSTIALPTFVLMWALMVAAMMTPSLIPLASRYLRVITTHRLLGVTGFVLGYLVIWVTTGLLVYVLARLTGWIALQSPRAATLTAAVIFAFGGFYQFAPLKNRCLARCRTPLALLLRYVSWRGVFRHVRVGLHQGAYCLGCCWFLMLLMFAFGIMNIGAMLVLAAVVTLEKAWAHGVVLSRIVGVVCCVLAVAVLLVPWLAPGLSAPASHMLMSSR